MLERSTDTQAGQDHDRQIATAVQAACLRAALEGYERASADGLCAEGALEVALDALRQLDVAEVLRDLKPAARHERH